MELLQSCTKPSICSHITTTSCEHYGISPVTQLFVKQFVEANNREDIEYPHDWSFVQGVQMDSQWISLTKLLQGISVNSLPIGPIMWKAFPCHGLIMWYDPPCWSHIKGNTSQPLNEHNPLTDPDSNVHGANMGPIWGRQDPGGPHVGPMNFAIWGPTFGGLSHITEK